MDLIQIVEYGLRAKGYDGLYYEDRCACKVGDLAPCGCLAEGCCPGVLIDIESCGNCTRQHPCDFHIGPKPNGDAHLSSERSEHGATESGGVE